jgi:hypothetical protein
MAPIFEFVYDTRTDIESYLPTAFNCVASRVYRARLSDWVRPYLLVNLHWTAIAAVVVNESKINPSVL